MKEDALFLFEVQPATGAVICFFISGTETWGDLCTRTTGLIGRGWKYRLTRLS